MCLRQNSYIFLDVAKGNQLTFERKQTIFESF
jgi:hypothetical protein